MKGGYQECGMKSRTVNPCRGVLRGIVEFSAGGGGQVGVV